MSVRRFADEPSREGVPLVPVGSSREYQTADVAPTPESVKGELNQDFDKQVGQQKKLSLNWKMALGIATGVLVGVAVLALVFLAVAATHGGAAVLLPILGHKALAALGVAHAYIASATAATAHALGGGSILIKALTVLFPAVLFLGGGTLGGKLFRKGELEQMDKMLGTSQQAFSSLEEKVLGQGHHLNESDIERITAQEESTILSSRVGKSFIEAKRRSSLHYRGWGDRIAKAFGHFWTAVPLTTVGSVASAPSHYKAILRSYDKEKQLKLDSSYGVRGANEQLNELRAAQVEQTVWLMDVMGNAYAEAPELVVYDRQITKLKALREKTEDTSHIAEINRQITRETAKKSQLMNERLEDEMKEQIFSETGPIHNLLTIKEDVLAATRELDIEHQGQILEAVAIFLGQNPSATVVQLNDLVKNLATKLPIHIQENSIKEPWRTRLSVMQYAKKAAENPDAIGDLALDVVQADDSEIRGAMIQTKRELRTKIGVLAVADVASAVIHATPIPGSSVVAGSVTAGAVASTKGWGLAAIRRRLSG